LAVTGVIVLLVLLSGPVATWLQARELVVAPEEWDGPVYLVAGARAQERRVTAAVEFVCAMGNAVPVVLIGNDTSAGRWCSDEQRGLTMGEWAIRKTSVRLLERGRLTDVTLLSRGFLGTHREMEILGRYLSTHPVPKRVALVTSPYHARRCVQRLAAHTDGSIEIRVVPVEPFPGDRAPWVVAIELGKMIRDGMGLSECPLFTRRGWRWALRFIGVEC